eukprot:Rmarinus@m.10604
MSGNKSSAATDETRVRVALKVRPLLEKEQEAGDVECITFPLDSEPQVTVRTLDGRPERSFTFDHVFRPDDNQEKLFEEAVQPLVFSALEGLNATVLAYGQTGSGKTYSMGTGDVDVDDGELGVLPRAIQLLFQCMKDRTDEEIELSATFLEIHNEEIHDLLATAAVALDEQASGAGAQGSKSTLPTLHIREDPKIGVTVVGAVSKKVECYDDMISCLRSGLQHRAVGGTLMNERSSRSHAIFTVHIERTTFNADAGQVRVRSCFHFVDLAGSERQKKTKAEGLRLKEAISINCGLLALGNVISALGDERKKGAHIPYRDSKLTRLLQDSLGGNSYTLMVACVSPADSNSDESTNTLRYANRARDIQNKPVVNITSDEGMVQSLKREVKRLQLELAQKDGLLDDSVDRFQKRVGALNRRLAEVEQERDTFRAGLEQILEQTAHAPGSRGLSGEEAETSAETAAGTSAETVLSNCRATVERVFDDVAKAAARFAESAPPAEGGNVGLPPRGDRLVSVKLGDASDDDHDHGRLDDGEEDDEPLDGIALVGDGEESQFALGQQLRDETLSQLESEIVARQNELDSLIAADPALSQFSSDDGTARASPNVRIESVISEYETKIQKIEQDLLDTKQERENMLVSLKHKENERQRLELTYKTKITRLQAQLVKFQDEQGQQKKLLKRVQKLEAEILEGKRQKNLLVRQQRAEAKKHSEKERLNRQELEQLRRKFQREEVKVKMLEQENKNQKVVLKRRLEDFQLSQKRVRQLETGRRTPRPKTGISQGSGRPSTGRRASGSGSTLSSPTSASATASASASASPTATATASAQGPTAAAAPDIRKRTDGEYEALYTQWVEETVFGREQERRVETARQKRDSLAEEMAALEKIRDDTLRREGRSSAALPELTTQIDKLDRAIDHQNELIAEIQAEVAEKGGDALCSMETLTLAETRYLLRMSVALVGSLGKGAQRPSSKRAGSNSADSPLLGITGSPSLTSPPVPAAAFGVSAATPPMGSSGDDGKSSKARALSEHRSARDEMVGKAVRLAKEMMAFIENGKFDPEEHARPRRPGHSRNNSFGSTPPVPSRSGVDRSLQLRTRLRLFLEDVGVYSGMPGGATPSSRSSSPHSQPDTPVLDQPSRPKIEVPVLNLAKLQLGGSTESDIAGGENTSSHGENTSPRYRDVEAELTGKKTTAHRRSGEGGLSTRRARERGVSSPASTSGPGRRGAGSSVASGVGSKSSSGRSKTPPPSSAKSRGGTVGSSYRRISSAAPHHSTEGSMSARERPVSRDLELESGGATAAWTERSAGSGSGAGAGATGVGSRTRRKSFEADGKDEMQEHSARRLTQSPRPTIPSVFDRLSTNMTGVAKNKHQARKDRGRDRFDAKTLSSGRPSSPSKKDDDRRSSLPSHPSVSSPGSTDVDLRFKCLHRVEESHSAPITALTARDDCFYSGSQDKIVRVWHGQSFQHIVEFRGHSSSVKALAVAEGSSKLVYSAGLDGVKVWDVASGGLVRTLEAHEKEVNALAVYGGKLYTASEDCTIRVWDIAGGYRLLRELRGHTAGVLCVRPLVTTFGTSCLVSASRDTTVKVWHVDSMEEVAQLTGPRDAVTCVYACDHGADSNPVGDSHGECTILAGSRDRSLQRWSVLDDEVERKGRYIGSHHDWVTDICITGPYWLTSSRDSTIKVYDAKSGRQAGLLHEHTGAVNSLAILSSRSPLLGSIQYILSSGNDRSIRVWSLQ